VPSSFRIQTVHLTLLSARLFVRQVKSKFKVAWVDASDPSKGFKYLYLTPTDYAALSKTKSVVAHRVVVGDEEQYVITDVIGAGEDLGVENLRGSATIAGEVRLSVCPCPSVWCLSFSPHRGGRYVCACARVCGVCVSLCLTPRVVTSSGDPCVCVSAQTCRANDSTFTLTYVTGRSVGIGAYLVRLGQRTIQKASNAPILLTGFKALNKLIGKDVYSSNLQLGGINIMHSNGVTHSVVSNDLEGASTRLACATVCCRRTVRALCTRCCCVRTLCDILALATLVPLITVVR
jgi:acetyl-CoA carboxylase/biotin carboxylase 1